MTQELDTIDWSKPLDNAREEKFAAAVAGGTSQYDAYLDAYPNSRKWKRASVDVKASRVAAKIGPRIEWIKAQATNVKICGIIERKEILSRIARGNLANFGVVSADGFVPNIGPECENIEALAGVTTRIITSGKGDGKEDAVIIGLKLRNPVEAIKELNDMEGTHAPTKGEVTVKGVTIAELAEQYEKAQLIADAKTKRRADG